MIKSFNKEGSAPLSPPRNHPCAHSISMLECQPSFFLLFELGPVLKANTLITTATSSLKNANKLFSNYRLSCRGGLTVGQTGAVPKCGASCGNRKPMLWQLNALVSIAIEVDEKCPGMRTI